MCFVLMFLVQMFLSAFQFFIFLRSITMIIVFLVFAGAVAMVVRFIIRLLYSSETAKEQTDYKDGWFGRGPKQSTGASETDDVTVHPFTINISDCVLTDLKQRLEKTRLAEPVEGVNFLYGFNPTYMKEVVDYWKEKYDWRKQEAELNKYPHFMTKVEGINIHFMHIKPKLGDRKIDVLPLMIIHGWPGCFAEFYKCVPLLTTPLDDQDFVFEVICPSIPGYGFSEAAHHPGMNSRAAGRIFIKLMERLGHPKFFVQGGDWGATIATNMSRYYPERISGLHINFCAFGLTAFDALKYVIVSLVPRLVSPEEYKLVYPMKQKFKMYLEETGYFHMQATKPDTLGIGLSDSPAGLAAYLLEKFSVATNASNVKLEDGGLTKKFTLDELITNVMIYWVTNSFSSSARFYKENVKDVMKFKHEKHPVTIPSGVAVFPHELLMYPRIMLSGQFKNLISYTIMPKGGHFAAMEEPELLSDDIWNFVKIIRERR